MEIRRREEGVLFVQGLPNVLPPGLVQMKNLSGGECHPELLVSSPTLHMVSGSELCSPV